jgi:hypothetical protein
MKYISFVLFNIVFFIFFILPIILILKNNSNRMRQKYNNRFTKPNIINDKQVNIYVKKYFSKWNWQWTTVGADGLPQILLTKKKGKGSGYRYWSLLSQLQIFENLQP